MFELNGPSESPPRVPAHSANVQVTTKEINIKNQVKSFLMNTTGCPTIFQKMIEQGVPAIVARLLCVAERLGQNFISI